MAFDKAKVVRAAEKYLAQGKISAAIKEYRQIVEHDTEDFTALNMLGDLYVRSNSKQEAIQCFARIAEHYREQGFALKAIAMYKKIDRLTPQDPAIASILASLYEMQGLIVDARNQYMIVAEVHSRAGQSRKALDVLCKIADLDPQNTEARIKLAQGYMREGLTDEAAKAFTEAGAQFLTRCDNERAIEAYTLALDIHPFDRTSLSGYLDAHIALGMPDEAAEVLEHALAQQPEDVELLSMLTRAYIEAEDASAAQRTVSALCEREPSEYIRFVDVARIYLKTNEVDQAVRVLTSITEQMLAGREEEELMKLLNEVLARDPEHVDALRLLVRVYTWQRDDEKQRNALERLVEAAEASGLVEVERSALLQLAQFAPDQRYLERLYSLGSAPEQEPQESSSFPGSSFDTGEEIPTFEGFSLDEEPATASAMGLPALEESSEFEWNSVASAPEPPDPAASFAELNDWTTPAAPDPFSSAEPAAEQHATGGFQEFDFGSEALNMSSLNSEANVSAAAGSAGETDVRREALLRQELGSIDFYIAQGYTDIALDTLEMLERQFGSHPEITERRTQLEQAAEPAPASDAAPVEPVGTAQFESFTLYDVAEEEPHVQVEGTELEDAFAALQSAPPAQTNGTNAEPPASSPAPAQTAPASQSMAGIDPGLAAIFEEFRSDEDETAAAADGDYETHYNLGHAYKEMALLDDAVEEFQLAAKMVSPQDGTPRYLQCCNMLGHCFMEKGMPRLAVMWFKKGLDAPGHTEDEYQALRYELGTAYEELGSLDQAIDVFTEVYGVNISYRGVADKLRELQAQKTSK